MRRTTSIFLILLMIGNAHIFAPAYACNYSSLMRGFYRLVARYNANPTMARADAICRRIRRIEQKFTITPPAVPPVAPPGVNCAPMPMMGMGRGGGPGGLIIGIGQMAVGSGWVRNFGPDPCMYTWSITPDPANPSGFTILPSSGSVMVPPNTSTAVDFDVSIAPAVPNGTTAFFDIEWIDTCTGLPLFPDNQRFQVTSDSELTVLPAAPFEIASPGVPLPVMFEITNHTASPVMRTFDFLHIGDPASEMELSDGTLFAAQNLFPVVPPPDTRQVTVTIDPFSTEMVLKEELMAGEICDPQMINCCALVSGAGTCCQMIFNDHNAPKPTAHNFQSLVGTAMGGGQIGFQISDFFVQIPTDQFLTAEQHIDILTIQTLNFVENAPGFNFFPFPQGPDFMLEAPIFEPIQFFSNDPGLQWLPPDPLLPNGPALFPQWGLGLPLPPDPNLGGLQLTTQALILDANGRLTPQAANGGSGGTGSKTLGADPEQPADRIGEIEQQDLADEGRERR